MWGGPDLDFPTLLLLSRHTSTKQRKENSRLSSLAKKKEISVRFSERWRWWRNQGMAAIPSISHLSLIALYSSVLASFPDIFILCGLQFLPSSLPPLSSLCHLQLHRKKKASNTPPPTTPAAWQWLQGMSRCAADQTGATSRPLHPRTSIWFKKAATASRYMLPAFPVMGRSKLIEDRVTSTLLTHSQDSITSSAKTKTQDSSLECYRWCVIKSW